MLRLKSRQTQIPNGFKFYLPELKWQSSSNYPSFDSVVQQLQSVILANPALAQQHKWPTDRAGVENWVDLYNATMCARMGWTDFIITDSGPSVPKSGPQLQNLQSLAAAAARAKDLIAGAKSLVEWIDSGADPVSPEHALSRAIICSGCSLNSSGDLTKWFTIPAAELIKRQVERMQVRKLTTPRDDLLNLCTACHCPLKLKVHVPIEWIEKRITISQVALMKGNPLCWIVKELSQRNGSLDLSSEPVGQTQGASTTPVNSSDASPSLSQEKTGEVN